jgi:hypothetical protein
MGRDSSLKISNSELQTYKRCKRKWYLEYYRELAPIAERQSGPRPIGTRVHFWLASYYDALMVGTPETDAFSMALEGHDAEVADAALLYPLEAEAITKDGDLSHIMLEGYFEFITETGADEDLTVIQNEQEVSTILDVKGTPVTIIGKLDQRLRRKSDGADMFLDHKTVQEFTSPTKTLHLDEQVRHYNWLLQQTSDLRVDGAIYNMLRKVKRTERAQPPFYSRFEVRFSQQEMDMFHYRLLGELREIIRTRQELDAARGQPHEAITAQVVAYPTPTKSCSYDCDFFALCPFMDRPQDAPEQIIEMSYTHKDPYKRYQKET